MRKRKTAMAAGALMFILSACGQTERTEETQKDEGRLVIEKIEDAEEIEDTEEVEDTEENDDIEEMQNTHTAGLMDTTNQQYEAFLHNEISVANPYVEGMNLTVMDDERYETEFEDAKKRYAYVDVNDDGAPELIFKITSASSELMYILGMCDNELTCFDVFESHTRSIDFGVYDYGFVWEIQDYDGFEMTFYTYTADGEPVEARRFTEENEADIAAYEGEEPEWTEWQYDGNTDNG